MLNDLTNYHVYVCKDGRTRAYNKETKAIVSYPKILMENILGRQLLPNEDVHHKDGNPLNNSPWNLMVIDHCEHERKHAADNGYKVKEKKNNSFEHKGRDRKYFDKEMVCPECGKIFIWTAYQQNRYKRSDRENVFCSRKCLSASKRILKLSVNEIVDILKKNNGNFTKTSKELGVSDNAIRKRLKSNNLPYKPLDYK